MNPIIPVLEHGLEKAKKAEQAAVDGIDTTPKVKELANVAIEKKGEGKPKCLSKARAASLRASGGKKAIAAAVRRKRRKDKNPERRGKAINVSNKKKKK